MGQLGDVVGGMQSAITDTLSNLPLPFEIPTIPGIPQGFSLPNLGIEGLTSQLSSSLSGLTETLTSALPNVIDAAQQLPSLVGDLSTTVTTQLQSALSQTPDLIKNSLDQVRGIFLRSP